MDAAKRVGRIIGLLLLAQGVGSFVMNFVLVRPITRPPGFLVNAAGSPVQLTLSVLLGLAIGATTLGIAIAAFPLFRRYSPAMALWFLALAVVGFSLIAVENVAVRTMLSVSQQYAAANAADAGTFRALGAVVGAARNWAHYTNLLVGGGAIVVLYAVLLRFALIPRTLAALGLLAGLLQLAAVTMPLFGQRMLFLMLMPLGLTHLALALWLVARGFADRPPLARAGARGVGLVGA